jgi:hypothetical protein
MEYTINFTNSNRLIGIGVIGMVLSSTIPIFLRISVGLDKTIMGWLFLTGILLPWIIAYFVSKQKETFLVNEIGLLTRKYGFIKWQQVEDLKLLDNVDDELFTIRLQSGTKIRIPSAINESPNRKTFLAFKSEVQSRVAQSRNATHNIIQHAYTFEGKGYRLLGYIFILALIIVTPYAIFLWVTGGMSAGKFVSAIVVYSSALPIIAKIFRNELFGRKNCN